MRKQNKRIVCPHKVTRAFSLAQLMNMLYYYVFLFTAVFVSECKMRIRK